MATKRKRPGKYRDPDARRAYMRDLMRRRRAAEKQKGKANGS